MYGLVPRQVLIERIGDLHRTVLHAGGKFDKDSYKVSGGLHGVGVSCVNALSIDLKATVHRGGKTYIQEYSKGKPLYDVKVIGDTDKTGTEILFKPDNSIFVVTEYNFEILASRLRELAFLNQGLKITLIDHREEDKKAEYMYKGGLLSFAEYLNE